MVYILEARVNHYVKRRYERRQERQKIILYSKMKEIGKDKFNIELYEEYPCENVEQLRMREGQVMREVNASLNSKIEGRTQQEWREDNKEYIKEMVKKHYENNKDKYSQQGKQYREEHKEYIKEWKKNRYETNKEEILQKQKEYHSTNKEVRNAKSREYNKNQKEKIKAKKNKSYECDCGVTYTHSNKSRHLKSKHHQNFILNNNINNVSQTEEEANSQACSSTHITKESFAF